MMENYLGRRADLSIHAFACVHSHTYNTHTQINQEKKGVEEGREQLLPGKGKAFRVGV